jgi:small-conductance mechanosensitive channel
VRGDVIDITPLRTKLLETGVSEPPPTGLPASTDSWVHGRQPTGRVVAVSNKATFDEPVFKYSSMWEFVWEEVAFPIAHSELEPRVYARATDNYMELSARFVVPVRTSRTAVNDLTRRIRDRLDEVDIPIASSTMDLTITAGSDRTTRESSRSG